MKKFLVKLLLIAVLQVSTIGLLLVTPLHTAYAAGESCRPSNADVLGLPTWFKYLQAEVDETGRCAPVLENTADALPIGIAILEAMLRIAGLVAVIMIFWASFKYLTTQGSGEAASAARKTATNALIGLGITILATGAVSFVGNRLI